MEPKVSCARTSLNYLPNYYQHASSHCEGQRKCSKGTDQRDTTRKPCIHTIAQAMYTKFFKMAEDKDFFRENGREIPDQIKSNRNAQDNDVRTIMND